MAHKYTEVSRRTIHGRHDATVVEVMYGCVCQDLIDVVVAPTLREARVQGRRGVRRHAALAGAVTMTGVYGGT